MNIAVLSSDFVEKRPGRITQEKKKRNYIITRAIFTHERNGAETVVSFYGRCRTTLTGNIPINIF